jgi:Ca-activated chloride channel family protein
VLLVVNFQAPLFLLALLAVPALLVYAVLMDRRRARFPVAFTNLEVLAGVVEERRSAWRRWAPLVLFLLSLTFAAGALARPRTHLTVPEDNASVVLVVDVSGSMRADDVEPTRLDAAISAMRAFLDRLPKRFKVGLVAFSSEAEVLTQPTRDRQVVRDALGYLQPEAGTAIGDGLDVAVKQATASLATDGIERKPNEDIPAAVVLLSDGAQNRGKLQPLEAAQHARDAGIKVYTVALGTPDGVVSFGFGLFVNSIPVPPDPPTMRAIARSTGGKTYTAQSSTKLSSIYKTLGSSIGRRTDLREITSWFAAIAAVLLVASLAAGRAWEGRLP